MMEPPKQPQARPDKNQNGASVGVVEDARIRLEMTRLLYRGLPQAITTSVVVAIALSVFLWSVADQTWLLVWLAALLLITSIRVFLVISFQRAQPVASAAERWAKIHSVGAALAGIIWGSLALLWNSGWPISYQVFLILVLTGMAAGAISTNTARMSSLTGFVIFSLLPLAGILLLQEEAVYAGLSLLVFVYAGMLVLTARNYHDSIKVSITQQFNNSNLIDELNGHVKQLNKEIVAREKAQSDLRLLNETLEQQVATRTKGLNEEIEQRIEVEQALEHAVNQTRSILEAVGEGIFGLDKMGKTTFINPAGARMLGWDAEELIGQNQHDMVHHMRADGSPYLHSDCLINKTLQTGQEQRVDGEVFWKKDGSNIPVEYFSAPIIEHGEVAGVVITFYDISERKRAEHALIESEQKFSAIADSAQDAIIMIDSAGDVVYWNPAASLITGYDRQEAIGKNLHHLIVPERFQRVHEQAFPHFINTGEGMAVGQTLELAAIHKGGHEFPVELSISSVQLQGSWHAIGMLRDISKRKQIEADIRHSRATYQTLVDNLPQRIFYKDKNSVYVSGNRQYALDLGIEPSELPGKTDMDFFPKELAEQYRADDLRIIEAGEIEDIEERYFKDGEERYIHTVKTPLKDDDGNPAGVLGIFWDITEQKHAEQKRQNLEVQLRQAQKLESVGQLAAGIAHEINTPTQFVNDNTHFLKDAFADYSQLLAAYDQLTKAAASGAVPQALLSKVNALVEEIDTDYLKNEIPMAISQSLDGLKRISKIVQAMKEFSHPGSEEKTPANINRAIETTIDVSRNEWKYCSELITEFDPELPQVPVILGEFNQVILNLIVNAAHSIDDVVRESGERGEIRITTTHDNEWAEIRISDTGKGIPEAIIKRIFDPFFTTKEVGKGSGQGLAIAWSVIVDKHGGSIEVESEQGKGSIFTIRLPIM